MELIGIDAKLYHGTAGATADQEIGIARDVNLGLEKGEADVTTRSSGGWKSTVGTLKDCTIEFDIKDDPNDAAYQALRDAFLQETEEKKLLALCCLDSDSGEGIDADFTITKFSRNEPREEGITYAVTARLNTSLRAPVWIPAA
jgi:hypothetical protein